DEELHQSEEQVLAHHARETESAQKEHTRSRREVTTRLDAEQAAADNKFQEKRWAADAALEGAASGAKTRLRELSALLTGQTGELEKIQARASKKMKEWKYEEAPVSSAPEDAKTIAERPETSLAGHVARAQETVEELEGLTLPRFQGGARLFSIFAILWL